MNNRTLAKTKNKNSTTFSPVFDKKLSGRTFTPEPAHEARDVPNSQLGHNFGNVQVERPSFIQSCPLTLSGPTHCPFGGVCHTCPPRVQTKLKIGEPGDKYEQEADRVAEQVMRMPEPQVQNKGCLSFNDIDEGEQIQNKPITAQITPLVQRQEAIPEEEEEEDVIQTKPHANQIAPIIQRKVDEEVERKEDEDLIQTTMSGNVNHEVTPAINSGIQSLPGGGQPLSWAEKSFFEPRFGSDFSNVRVHNDTRAASIARLVNARAFTVERNVVFGAGEYSPDTSEGRKLLAHELTHVVQQNLGQNLFSAGKNSENTKPSIQELSIVSPEFTAEITPHTTSGKKLIGHELTHVIQQGFSRNLGAGTLTQTIQRDPEKKKDRKKKKSIAPQDCPDIKKTDIDIMRWGIPQVESWLRRHYKTLSGEVPYTTEIKVWKQFSDWGEMDIDIYFKPPGKKKEKHVKWRVQLVPKNNELVLESTITDWWDGHPIVFYLPEGLVQLKHGDCTVHNAPRPPLKPPKTKKVSPPRGKQPNRNA